jgi:hypothetical protein
MGTYYPRFNDQGRSFDQYNTPTQLDRLPLEWGRCLVSLLEVS